MAERAELREFESSVLDDKPHSFQDPWARCDEDGDEYDAWLGIWGNALLDAPPIEDDAPWEQAVGDKKAPAQRPRKTRKSKHDRQAFLPGMEAWLS